MQLRCATAQLMFALPPLHACTLQIGAQCAHAAVGAVERLHELRQTAALAYWERCGQPKVCLRASSTQVLKGAHGGVGRLAAAAATADRLRRMMPPLPLLRLPTWLLCCLPRLLQELRQLAAAASGQGLPTFVVQDAGEALGIMPMPADHVAVCKLLCMPLCRSWYLLMTCCCSAVFALQAARRWPQAAAPCWPLDLPLRAPLTK